MWKDLLDEQDDIFCAGLPSPIQSTRDNDKVTAAHEASEPRPALAMVSSCEENLEDVVVRPGFQFLDNGHSASPTNNALEESTTMLGSEHVDIADPPESLILKPLAMTGSLTSYESIGQQYADIYHQIDGDKLVAEADEQSDLDHDAYGVAGRADPPVAGLDRQFRNQAQSSSGLHAVQRLDSNARRNSNNMQVDVVGKDQVQPAIVTFHGTPGREESEALAAERASELTGVEEATVVRRPCAGTIAVDGAERTTPGPAPFCILEGETKKNKPRKQKSVRPPLDSPTAKDHVVVAEYVQSAEKKHTTTECTLSVGAAEESVIAEKPVLLAGKESHMGRCGVVDSSAGQDGASRRAEYVFETPAAPDKVASDDTSITNTPATGDHLPKYTKEDDHEIAYKMLYNGMQEICQKFRVFDRLGRELDNRGGGRKELNRMHRVLKRTDERMKDIAFFANEHQLSDLNTYKETMQNMVDGMQVRQKSLWAFGVKLWNVSQFSEAYCRNLKREAPGASGTGMENSGKSCVEHCWWHSPSECMDDDDVFQV
jgi:hypothetical protein